MIFAADESRFGRITTTGRCWAPKRIRPIAKVAIVRQYVYLFMAVCPLTGESTSLILPLLNAQMMQIFLGQLSTDFPHYFIVMQIDNAGGHIATELILPENIRVIYQPPYCPQLNPIEEVFDYIKENDFRNRVFDSLDDVENQRSRSVNTLQEDKHRLKSMTSYPHLHGNLA